MLCLIWFAQGFVIPDTVCHLPAIFFETGFVSLLQWDHDLNGMKLTADLTAGIKSGVSHLELTAILRTSCFFKSNVW